MACIVNFIYGIEQPQLKQCMYCMSQTCDENTYFNATLLHTNKFV